MNLRTSSQIFWGSSQTLGLILVLGFIVGKANAFGVGDYTNEWAVEIDGGDDVAEQIALQHDFEILGKIFEGVYHLRHKRLVRRSTSSSDEHHEAVTSHPKVLWAEQQIVKKRVKRDYHTGRLANGVVKKAIIHTRLNDPKWPDMWYLNRGGSLDMNVQAAWNEDVTGKGVVVTILDDGLEKDHPDIIKNYDPNASYDVNNLDTDPMPRYDLIDSNRHGTRCAGEVAADANNSICAVGVAYEASIGGVRMLDGDVTDAVEARSLALNPQHIDIYSASWGPDDDGKTVDGPGKLATRAFIEGITGGRNGKGSIFVWASGNGGRDMDNCNCDGYTNSIWTLSISSSTEKGHVPWYSEACSSTLATTYSSGSQGESQIITTDLHHSCTTSHTGTSASAPLAAGICALALQVNRDMTWRDMQHVVVRTARPGELEAPDWQTNGVGRQVSHRFGYGLMDAYAMVKLARKWISVPTQHTCQVTAPHANKLIPLKSFVTLNLEVVDCPGVNYLEHVQAKITLMADRRGDLEIYLTSPSGTKSTVLYLRPHDTSRNGFHAWPFMTVHMWGEKPLGTWQLEIHNNGHYFSTDKAGVKNWTMLMYGTETEPGKPISGTSGDYVKSNTLVDTNKNSVSMDSPSYTPKGSTEEREKKEDYTTLADSNNVKNKDIPSKSSASSNMPSPVPLHLTAPKPAALPPGCLTLDASGACIGCVPGQLIHNGECVHMCPTSYYPDVDIKHKDNGSTKCHPCHYSCWSCTGPLDYQCTHCWGDAIIFSPTKDEHFCHAESLMKAYEIQQWWNSLVLILMVIVLIVVIILSIVVLRARKLNKNYNNLDPLGPLGPLGSTHRPHCNAKAASYARVAITDSDQIMTKIPFHDSSSDDEQGG